MERINLFLNFSAHPLPARGSRLRKGGPPVTQLTPAVETLDQALTGKSPNRYGITVYGVCKQTTCPFEVQLW